MPKLNDPSPDWCGFWAFPASFNKSRPWQPWPPLPASAKGRQPLHPRCLSKVEVPRVDCTKIIEDIKAFQLYVRVNMYHTYREMGSYGIISSRSILYHYTVYDYISCKLWHWNCLLSHVYSCFEVQNPSSNATGGGPSQLGVPNPRMIKMSEHPNKQRIWHIMYIICISYDYVLYIW